MRRGAPQAPFADKGTVACLVAILLAAALPAAHAQAVRDPTVPPASAASAPSAGAARQPADADIGPVAVILREGCPYLVVGTRLYAPGQSLGSSRIERITETEVWLREGRTLHKKPIFSGIVRSSAGGPPPTAACAVAAEQAPPAPRRISTPAARTRAESAPVGEKRRP